MVSFSAGQNMNINVHGNQTITEGGQQIPPDIKALVEEVLTKNPELLKKDEKGFIKAIMEKIPKLTADLAPIIAKAVLL